jgi:hypothetical protein
MKINHLIYTVSAFSLTFSSLGFSYDEPISNVAVSPSHILYSSDFPLPSNPISLNQKEFLNAFMSNPKDPAFSRFSKEKIRHIDLAIAFHGAELDSSKLEHYRNYQIGLLFPSEKEASNFQKVITALQKGEKLSKSQDSLVKTFAGKVSSHPELSLQPFYPNLLTYVQNNPKTFNAKEVERLKTAALMINGISPRDLASLNQMASMGSNRLEGLDQSQILNLLKLTHLTALGLEGVFEASQLLTLQGIILDHQVMFNPSDIDHFNRALANDPRVIKFKAEHPHFNPNRKSMTPPNSQAHPNYASPKPTYEASPNHPNGPIAPSAARSNR